ncbi:hypothetical protein BT96DRAFT_935018 [Gymnopus androsaceus JB14]|uniref:Uncharacterized protein n=1 Tax=Gymnopus androsaceus JB14 TaxID=1447944 RepID=A0A6A4I476_9AGAR|nr:hypothetical protein BT96DRAFT_935018 [Gymnopus androsaceus JB14]
MAATTWLVLVFHEGTAWMESDWERMNVALALGDFFLYLELIIINNHVSPTSTSLSNRSIHPMQDARRGQLRPSKQYLYVDLGYFSKCQIEGHTEGKINSDVQAMFSKWISFRNSEGVAHNPL